MRLPEDLEIQRDHISVNKFSRPGKILSDVRAVVIHWTANPGTTAKQNRNFFELRKNGEHSYGSTQFLVGLDGEIVEAMPPTEMAYHVGGRSYTEYATRRLGGYPNARTIGIEMCVDAAGDHPPATVDVTARLTAALCHEHALRPESSICRHWDVTGKVCPKFYVGTPGAFLEFVHHVADEYRDMADEYEVY